MDEDIKQYLLDHADTARGLLAKMILCTGMDVDGARPLLRGLFEFEMEMSRVCRRGSINFYIYDEDNHIEIRDLGREALAWVNL